MKLGGYFADTPQAPADARPDTRVPDAARVFEGKVTGRVPVQRPGAKAPRGGEAGPRGAGAAWARRSPADDASKHHAVLGVARRAVVKRRFKRRVGTPEPERGSASRDCPELPSALADDTLPGTCLMALS